MRSPSADPPEKSIKRRLLSSRNSLLFLLLLVVLAGCSFAPEPILSEPPSVRVEGLVSLHARSYAGATVSFVRTQDLSGEGWPVATALTDAKGRFGASLPPGDYIVTASAPGHFALFGRNPVRAHADQKGLSLPLARVFETVTSAVSPGNESITGVVYEGDAPAEGAVVQAYLDARRGFKGPPYAASTPSGSDGSFTLPLEPGSYFIVAKRRTPGQKIGPLEAGDLFGSLPDFPLTLRSGEAKSVSIEMVKLPSHEMMARYTTNFAILTGRVVDGSGAPVSGFRPCLYANQRMVDEPVAVGDPTGPDGLFRLKTSRVGRFWLGARERLGGPPLTGERIGFPGAEGVAGFELSPGVEFEGLLLTIRRAP